MYVKPHKKPTKSQEKTTTLKLGHFQLSTPSFWTTLVCILCLFLFLQTAMTIYMFDHMVEKLSATQLKLVETILSINNKPQ